MSSSMSMCPTMCPPPTPVPFQQLPRNSAQPPPPPPPSYTNGERKPIQLEECKWAATHPEIQKACYLSRVCLVISPKSCRLKDVRPILQEGPTCGLAAVSMLANGRPSTEELLCRARRSFYTKNGEMFSARNLFDLVNGVMDGERIGTRLYDGRLYSGPIKQVLQNGGCLLVPYPLNCAKKCCIFEFTFKKKNRHFLS